MLELCLKEDLVDLQLEEDLGLGWCSGPVWMLLQEPALVLWHLGVHQQGPGLELLRQQRDRSTHSPNALRLLNTNLPARHGRRGPKRRKADAGSAIIAKLFQVFYRLPRHGWFFPCVISRLARKPRAPVKWWLLMRK